VQEFGGSGNIDAVLTDLARIDAFVK